MPEYAVPALFSLGTFLSTLAGGAFAVRFRHKSHLILGFIAGFLLGVTAFDIFPEIIAQVQAHHFDPMESMAALVVSFLIIHVAERLIVIHHAHEAEYAAHRHPQIGILSALALAGHSFMDGAGIGMGFQVSRAVGVVVAAAVISHDFTDGMNTVSVMLSNKNTTRKALLYLLLDAAAPILGLCSTFVFSFSPRLLVLYLGSFAGLLLYIGASDILPEAHSECNSGLTTVMTVAGAFFAFALSRIV